MDTGHHRLADDASVSTRRTAACSPDLPSQAPRTMHGTPPPVARGRGESDAEPAGRPDSPAELEYASWLRVLRQQRA